MPSRIRPLLLSFLLAPIVVVASGLSIPAAGAAAPGDSEVYVVIGVDEAVDVLIDDETVESGADAKSILGPYELAPGDHAVEFVGDGWAAAADVSADRPSIDVVVHRPADPQGDPEVSVFGNDIDPVAADEARLTIAHTAVVPPADVRVEGDVLFSNIANGEFVSAVVEATTYSVDIVPTGEDTPLLGPLDLTLEPGALNRVFAVGRPQNGTMDAIVQVIPLVPTDVAAGTGGMAGIEGAAAPWRMGPAGVAMVVLGAALFVIGSGRRGRHAR
jgi:hypothetical protein